jgi:hypothetical protein
MSTDNQPTTPQGAPWLERLHALRPCDDGLIFASQFKTWQECWDNIDRGDWSLWVVGRLSGPPESDGRKKLVLACCECVRLALPIFEKRYPEDNRVLVCIETTEKWARGEATIEQVKQARRVCYIIYAYTYDAAAAAAAAAYDALAACNAAAAAADAADAAERTRILKQCADIVRKYYPQAPELPVIP